VGSHSTKQMSKAVSSAQLFDFFSTKVNAVHQSTGYTPVQTILGQSPAVFEKFDQCSIGNLWHLKQRSGFGMYVETGTQM